MLDEPDPTISSKAASDWSKGRLKEEKMIQICISRLSERLRQSGYTESAHFVDIAALTMRE